MKLISFEDLNCLIQNVKFFILHHPPRYLNPFVPYHPVARWYYQGGNILQGRTAARQSLPKKPCLWDDSSWRKLKKTGICHELVQKLLIFQDASGLRGLSTKQTHNWTRSWLCLCIPRPSGSPKTRFCENHTGVFWRQLWNWSED